MKPEDVVADRLPELDAAAFAALPAGQRDWLIFEQLTRVTRTVNNHRTVLLGLVGAVLVLGGLRLVG